MALQIVFWSSIGLIFYAYFGYPILLKVLSVLRQRPVRKGNHLPSVSFIIAAHNEETRIRDKLENTLKQEYPPEKLEIIVASDCSSDGTDALVRSYESYGVRLVTLEQRMGKEAAQKEAVNTARGEILVFTDVSTILPANAVGNMVRNFSDPTVGCVSSVDRVIDGQGTISGEGAYVRYEMVLRRLETKVNTLVGLSGSFFAARRSVCQAWDVNLQSDFNTLLNAVRMGLRGISDPESIGYYRSLVDERQEFDRKVRTVLRGLSVLMQSLNMLDPLRYKLFSWQLFSHKLCRWLVPFAMVLAFVSNALLISQPPAYTSLFIFQVLFYGIAVLGIRWDLFRDIRLLKIPSFFVLVNVAILSAWYRYFKGERLTTWHPSNR